jgi:hypothetical protein
VTLGPIFGSNSRSFSPAKVAGEGRRSRSLDLITVGQNDGILKRVDQGTEKAIFKIGAGPPLVGAKRHLIAQYSSGEYSPLASRCYSAIVKIYAGTPGLLAPPQNPAHGALHRVGAGSVKNFWR